MPRERKKWETNSVPRSEVICVGFGFEMYDPLGKKMYPACGAGGCEDAIAIDKDRPIDSQMFRRSFCLFSIATLSYLCFHECTPRYLDNALR